MRRQADHVFEVVRDEDERDVEGAPQSVDLVLQPLLRRPRRPLLGRARVARLLGRVLAVDEVDDPPQERDHEKDRADIGPDISRQRQDNVGWEHGFDLCEPCGLRLRRQTEWL